MTVPPRILKDLVASFPRRPIVYVLDVPGYQFGEATIDPVGQRIVALSQRLYRLVDNTLLEATRESLAERVTIRFSPIIAGDDLVVGVLRNDGPGEVHIKVEDLES